MRLRTLILAPALWAMFSMKLVAAPIPLTELSAYLNSIQTVRGEFTQINSDGSVSTGTVYIKRPGRVRFEYDPPDETLVMAGGGQVAIFDAKSNTGPEQYPLKRTPLSIILDERVDLSRARMVVGHREEGLTTVVTAQDPENPEYGNIQLVFTGDPVELRQWIISDGSGTETTVVLGEMERDVRLAENLFSIPAEIGSRQLPRGRD